MPPKKGRAGTHSSLIEAAEPLVAALERHGRVSRGVIRANAGAAGRSVKAVSLDGCLRITVVAKGARQELHAYGISVAQLREALDSPAYRSFSVNLPP